MRAKQLISILLIVCMLATFMPTVFVAAQNFEDFPTGWSKEAMTAAVNNGLLVGVSATEIRPTANLTRAELAAIVVRAFGATTKADISAFTDVAPTAWYYDYIAKAVKMEALNGKSENSMDPESPITREEVFTVLARILVLESDNTSVLSKFKDGSTTSSWAIPSIAALVEKGYVNGDDLGNLNPKANITREEFAQFMHNMIKVYITKPGVYTDDMSGITVLRVGGVTLKNLKQTYDLVAGDGVNFDDVKIEDVEIIGRLLARGGEFTIKRTTVSENVVVKNVNGVVHFNNYRTEAVFSGIKEITKATFLERGGSGGSSRPVVPSVNEITVKFEIDGKVVDTIDFEEGDVFESLPAIPAKTGYTALGWFYNGTKIEVGDKVPVGESSITLVAKYEINRHTVTFKLDNGEADVVIENVKYGEKIAPLAPTPSKAGYKFEGWSPAIDADTVLGDEAVTYTAIWSLLPPTDAQYTVKHIREALDGTDGETETEVLTGTIGQKTDAKAKTYEGFTAQTFEQVDVLADGSAVVTIKYLRNKHAVTFKLDNGEADVVIDNVKYGASIAPLAPTPSKTGYKFEGWSPAIDADTVLGDEAVTYTAIWSLLPPTDAQYTVKHIREALDGTDGETETEVLTGTIGQKTDAKVKTYEGFTAQTFEQVDVLADGSAVVTIKYLRNTHKVTFKLDNGEADVVIENVKYGASIQPLAPTPSKTGYKFEGWSPAIDADTVLGDAPVTYTAVWSLLPPTEAQYTVKHIREALDGTDGETETEVLTGTIGQKTDAKVKTYEGFTAQAFEQVDVLADGSAVVTIKYLRNKHAVTFKLDNGEADVVIDNVKYGASIAPLAPTPSKTGYKFEGWSPAIDADTVLGDEAVTYTAVWSLLPPTEAQYTVKHIREALDGTDGETETETLTGTIGQKTEAVAKTYEGFTAQTFEQIDVLADGSAVVTIKYLRNKHAVTFKLDNGEADVVIENVKYGASIAPLAPTPSKTGYKFEGWSPAIDADTVLGDEDVTYTAVWSLLPPTEAQYTVKHIREALDGTDGETETETLTGTIGQKTEAVAKTYEGFTAQTFEQIDVLADGSAVVTIKYLRNKHAVTFKLDNGEADVVIDNVKYGASIAPLAPTPSKTGYKFEGWSPAIDADTVLGDEAVTYTAVWSLLPPTEAQYTVKHIREALDGTDGETETEVLTGTIGQKTEAVAKTYEGFTAQTFEQVDVLADGSAVVTIKYLRNKHAVTFKLDNGEADVVIDNVKYGASIAPLAPAGFTKDGYKFEGWSPAIDVDTVLGDEAVTYTAVWSLLPPTDAQYTVKHVREALDGTDGETETEVLTGTIGQKTEAVAKTYEGFTAQTFEQVDVLADGSAVVTIKYLRNKHTVTFKLDNGEADVVIENVKYGASIEPLAPTGLTKEGATFDKWSPALDAATVMPDKDVEYTAMWIAEQLKVRFLVGEYGSPILLDEVTVDYGTSVAADVIDAQPVYREYGYKKLSGFAPFYNNERHIVYSDYWYINDKGEWELFDENVVITENTDVYAWFKYLKVQLTVPQFISLSPPIDAAYTPDDTRIMDTTKDLMYAANNIWIKNIVGEDKYVELREKALAKIAKTGVINEDGAIKITEIPVPITNVIKPEDIHKEVKLYIREIITDDSKLDQIFNMVSPAELVTLIGTEKLLGMLSDEQIADIITNQMDRDNIIDMIVGYPDVQEIVISYLKKLITPDPVTGTVENLALRNEVIAQIEHQLATDADLRAHILTDIDLLDSVLTSFESEIEHRAVNDDEFITAILANDSIRVAMIESLLTNDSFIDVLKTNATLKAHVVDTIKGDLNADVIDLLNNNDSFKSEILDAIKNDSALLALLNSGSIAESMFNAMGSYGTSDDIKNYVINIAEERYGIDNITGVTDYSAIISVPDVESMIADMEADARVNYPGISDTDLQVNIIQELNDSWNTIWGDENDPDSLNSKAKTFKENAIDAFVNNNGDLTGTDYEAVQSMIDDSILSVVADFVNGASLDGEIEGKIAEIIIEFVMQDINAIADADVKAMVTDAQNAFKVKAKTLDADTIAEAFINYRDEDAGNVPVLEQAIATNYADIVTYIESNMSDPDGEIYKTIDTLLAENAEDVSYDTFAALLNILLKDDDVMITEYFEDYVGNDANRTIVRAQVDEFIDEGNINATFVATHRDDIVNVLTSEGVDLNAYVTVDIIKSYIDGIGSEDDKIAFADEVYNALEQVDEYNEFMSSFDQKKDTFTIHKDNTLFVMGIAEAIKGFSYEQIIGMVDNKLVDKVIDVFGKQFLKELFEQAQDDYYQGIVDIVNEIDTDIANGVEPKTYEYSTALTFKVNLAEMLVKAYNKAQTKALSILDNKNVNYTENQYLDYLLTNDYLAEILEETTLGEADGYTGYGIRSEQYYYEMILKYVIILDDAICWYGDNYTEEQIRAIASAVLTKTFNIHDKINEILTEYRATGDLPEKADKVLNGVEQINNMFTKYQPQINKVVDKYLASALNKHFEPGDVLDKDKVQTSIDIMLGTDDPTFDIDVLYEIFYHFDGKVQSKLKQLIDSGKLEKAVKKFEETDLVQLIGNYTDNSKVTSLAEKANEIKESGKVKTAFNSIYDLLVLIAEHGIEPFRVDEDVITVEDAYEVSVKGMKFKIAREFR